MPVSPRPVAPRASTGDGKTPRPYLVDRRLPGPSTYVTGSDRPCLMLFRHPYRRTRRWPCGRLFCPTCDRRRCRILRIFRLSRSSHPSSLGRPWSPYPRSMIFLARSGALRAAPPASLPCGWEPLCSRGSFFSPRWRRPASAVSTPSQTQQMLTPTRNLDAKVFWRAASVRVDPGLHIRRFTISDLSNPMIDESIGTVAPTISVAIRFSRPCGTLAVAFSTFETKPMRFPQCSEAN